MTAALPIDIPSRRPPPESARALTSNQLTVLAAVLLAVAALMSISIGSTGITLTALPRVVSSLVFGDGDAATAREQLVLVDIRLPRLLLGLFVGSALAVAGAMMQGMFRNPLADPYLLGLSGGAGLGAVVAIALHTGATWAVPLAAFAGALA